MGGMVEAPSNGWVYLFWVGLVVFCRKRGFLLADLMTGCRLVDMSYRLETRKYLVTLFRHGDFFTRIHIPWRLQVKMEPGYGFPIYPGRLLLALEALNPSYPGFAVECLTDWNEVTEDLWRTHEGPLPLWIDEDD